VGTRLKRVSQKTLFFLFCISADIHLNITKRTFCNKWFIFTITSHFESYLLLWFWHKTEFFAQAHLVDEGEHSYWNYSILIIATLLDIFCWFHLFSAYLFTYRLSTGSYCKLQQKCKAFISFILVNKILSNILHVYNNQLFLNWEHLTHYGGFLCTSHATYVFSNKCLYRMKTVSHNHSF